MSRVKQLRLPELISLGRMETKFLEGVLEGSLCGVIFKVFIKGLSEATPWLFPHPHLT